MTQRSTAPRLTLALTFMAALALAGCGNDDANTEEAKLAEKATGISPKDSEKKNVVSTRNEIVITEKKVIDEESGKVLLDEKKQTKVKLVEEKQEKKQVKVDVVPATGDNK